MPEDDVNELITLTEKLIQSLDVSQAIMFGCCCCERLIPNFIAYSVDSGENSASEFLSNTTSLLWKSFPECDFTKLYLDSHVKDLLAIQVDETSISPYVGLAADSLQSVWHLLNYILDRNKVHILKISTVARESVEEWVRRTTTRYDLRPAKQRRDEELKKILGIVDRVDRGLEAIKVRLAKEKQWMNNHPFLKAEVLKQVSDLDIIIKFSNFDSTLTEKLKSSQHQGIQPFLRGFAK